MTPPNWMVDRLFDLNNITVIGWLTLVFAPFHKFSKYFVLSPALFLSILYSMILFQTLFVRGAHSLPLDFFHLSKWLTVLKDPFIIMGITNHFCVMDLWLGQWMVNDFYSGYTYAYSLSMDGNGTYQMKKSWTFGRLVFTAILLITYLASPFGFLVYHLAKFTFLKKYKNVDRIDYKDDQKLNETADLSPLQTETLNRRYVRFGDQLSGSLRKIYHILFGIFGLIILFTIALPAYICLRIYSRIIYRPPSTQITPNKFFPEHALNVSAHMKFVSLTTPIEKRNWIWYLKFLLLQISTFIEYIPNSFDPVFLFQSLQDYFTALYDVPYFAFGDGIGVGSYELVKRYLQDLPPRKGFESLGWAVSTSQATFCDFTTTFLSTDNPETKLGRDIIFKWLHSFPHHLTQNDSKVRLNLSRLVPRKLDEKPDRNTVFQAVGEVMFFLATGGELKKHERAAFIDCVKNPLIFFPNWFNFLLAGHYLERKNLNSYYTLLQAFARYADGPAIRAALKVAGQHKSQHEVLKLIAIVFSIAGSAAPAKLAFAVVSRLWEEKNREKNVRWFKKNPHNYIKECARLDKVVPMVNVLATSEIAQEIEESFQRTDSNITIPENTPIHCSLVSANRDKNVFQKPDEFNPDRPDLNKIIIWNGVEEDIINKDKTKRPVRYCPGHDLTLEVIQFVVEQFLPVVTDDEDEETKDEDDMKGKVDVKYSDDTEQKLILMKSHLKSPNETDQHCYSALDTYTKVVIKLVQLAVNETNSSPARAVDINKPFNLPTQDLSVIRLAMAKFIPSWDEDTPKGVKLVRRLARWLVNIRLWGFHDSLLEFKTLDQALQWRSKMFPAMPLPNVVYQDMLSDEAMTRLAFAGCACHYTRRIGDTWHPGQGSLDGKLLANAVYVNDMTGLATFSVRKPFERYGAAAYFDENFRIIAIYWSHRSRFVKKGEKCWNHAKYVWRSSFFAYVTIRDHLIVTHMIEGNAFVTASRRHLPTDHPLRRFIKPFTYHNISINYQAAISLVNERGLVHRIWAFDYDEFLRMCDYISMNYKFRLLPDMISKTMHPSKNNKTDDEWEKIYPIYHDLNAFWEIIQRYVTNFFRINYNLSIETDNVPQDSDIIEFSNEICKQLGIAGITSLRHLIDVISQLIAASTGIHEHVGQISDYLIDPRFIGAKLQEGKEIQNIQTYSQILLLSIVTGLRMPGLLEDWSHLIENDQYYHENLKNYQNFKRELHDLSDEIDCRNKKRHYPFESFNPKYMECSTSV